MARRTALGGPSIGAGAHAGIASWNCDCAGTRRRRHSLNLRSGRSARNVSPPAHEYAPCVGVVPPASTYGEAGGMGWRRRWRVAHQRAGERGAAPGTPAPRRPAHGRGQRHHQHATSVPVHGPAGPAARVPLLASPNRSPKMLAAAQPPPVDEADERQRSGDRDAAACHAVYRELGGVPTPPNLRPMKPPLAGEPRPPLSRGCAAQSSSGSARR